MRRNFSDMNERQRGKRSDMERKLGAIFLGKLFDQVFNVECAMGTLLPALSSPINIPVSSDWPSSVVMNRLANVASVVEDIEKGRVLLSDGFAQQRNVKLINGSPRHALALSYNQRLWHSPLRSSNSGVSSDQRLLAVTIPMKSEPIERIFVGSRKQSHMLSCFALLSLR